MLANDGFGGVIMVGMNRMRIVTRLKLYWYWMMWKINGDKGWEKRADKLLIEEINYEMGR